MSRKSTLLLTMALAACGNSTMGTQQDSGVVNGDVVRAANSPFCPFFEGTDGGVLRLDSQGRPTTALMAWPVLCHPNMRAGDPCIATGGGPGRCSDFAQNSSGRFPDYSENNRLALYCLREGGEICADDGLFSENCPTPRNCTPVPDPLPGRPRFVCFPPVCNP